MNNTRLSIQQLREGVLKADRMVLSRAITLVESTRPDDMAAATELMSQLNPHTGQSIRIGITGVPGVGKSTFIESFGELITAQGHKLAVLTIDPSSQLTRGSILGDKTRMETLSRNPNAFIRPSASGNILGGVAGKTRETILICEAAGFDVILVETVGVGQSEVTVRNMVDFFLLLMLAGAGDELQGIKKGIMEMADAVVITKADGDNVKHATEAQAEYQHALHLFPSSPSGWKPPVLVSSAQEKKGLTDVWKMIGKFAEKTRTSGWFESLRQKQNTIWFLEYFKQLLQADVASRITLKNDIDNLTSKIASENLSPLQAANELLQAYHRLVKDQ